MPPNPSSLHANVDATTRSSPSSKSTAKFSSSLRNSTTALPGALTRAVTNIDSSPRLDKLATTTSVLVAPSSRTKAFASPPGLSSGRSSAVLLVRTFRSVVWKVSRVPSPHRSAPEVSTALAHHTRTVTDPRKSAAQGNVVRPYSQACVALACFTDKQRVSDGRSIFANEIPDIFGIPIGKLVTTVSC